MHHGPIRAAVLCLVGLLIMAAPAYGATLVGTSGDDVLTGTESADRVDAQAGNDSLSGLGGPDLLFGEIGDDSLDGGDGNDRLGGGTGADLLKGGYGLDRLNVSDGDRAYGGPQLDEVVASNGTRSSSTAARDPIESTPAAVACRRCSGTAGMTVLRSGSSKIRTLALSAGRATTRCTPSTM